MRVLGVGAVAGLACLGSLTGCMASISTRVEEPIPPSHVEDVTVLAVMPGAIEHGSEWLRPHAMRTLVAALEDRFPGTVIIGPEDAARRLADRVLAREYAALLDDFQDAGVVDPDRIAVIAAAVGASHFLTTRAGYSGEPIQRTGTNLDGSPLVYDTKRQSLTLVARLWEPSGHAPSWEAVVHSNSQAGFLARDRPPLQIVDELVFGLADRLELALTTPRTAAGEVQ